jgi:hypothetical protein
LASQIRSEQVLPRNMKNVWSDRTPRPRGSGSRSAHTQRACGGSRSTHARRRQRHARTRAFGGARTRGGSRSAHPRQM